MSAARAIATGRRVEDVIEHKGPRLLATDGAIDNREESSVSELQIISGQSPFDEGRIQCPQGGEDRWSARWLMGQLTYESWQKFEGVIERAKVTAHNEGFNVKTLFRLTSKAGAGQVFTGSDKNSGGRPGTDYLVTRYAAYLIAMNGDPRKPAVSAAQHYFAVRTREAETASRIPDITTPDGLLALTEMFADTARKLVAADVERKALAAAIERDAPLVAKAEAHTVSDSAIHRQEFAREVKTWGIKQGIVIQQAEVMRFLGHLGLFIRGDRSDTGHATSDAIKRGLAFTHKDTAKNGHAYAVGKLTPAGQDYAWKRITKYVADHGSLALPRELRGGEAS